MILETVVVGALQVNCYILACAPKSDALIIDPGDQVQKINAVLKKNQLRCALVINTHGHYDHIGCDDEFGTSIYVHKLDLPMLKSADKNLSSSFSLAYNVKSDIKEIEEKEVIKLDCIELEVLHLPGHTPGGIGLLMKSPYKDIVFTGDTLFFHGVGRYDLDGGSRNLLEKSIKEKLFVLPDDTIVYPGHGPRTTIGSEKKQGII